METDTVGSNSPKQSQPYDAAYTFFVLASVAITLTGLYLTRDFLIPLVLALLLYILGIAAVDRISAWKPFGQQIPVWLAHILALALVLSGVLAFVAVLANQAEAVFEAVPRYALRLQNIGSSIASAFGEKAAASAQRSIDQLDLGAGVAAAAGSAGSFLNGLFLIMLYLPFLLLERSPFRRKLTKLIPSPEDAASAEHLVQSISISLQRYVGIKTIVSLLTAGFCYLVMKPLGLDFAETWALLAFVLNFIPSIGSILGVVFPALVALVQFDTLTPFFIIAFGCGMVQLIIGNVLEPALTGKSLNLSTLAVVLSLTFWGSLWGMAGAFLSVPITVVVMIVCAHLPSFRWAAVLLSGDGDISPRPISASPPGKVATLKSADPQDQSPTHDYPATASTPATEPVPQPTSDKMSSSMSRSLLVVGLSEDQKHEIKKLKQEFQELQSQVSRDRSD